MYVCMCLCLYERLLSTWLLGIPEERVTINGKNNLSLIAAKTTFWILKSWK